jgi:cell division cycle 2-like protein
MASRTSKWADDDDEEAAAAVALRKKEKEEKKRLKEQKARQAAETTAQPAPSTPQEPDGKDGRPSKRRRTSPSQSNGAAAEEENEGAHLLQFPSRPLQPCGHVSQYETLNNIEEGSYGFVSRARTKTTGTIVALKRLKMHNETSDGFPVTGLREIQTLMSSRHANVVKLLEVVMGDTLKE